MTRILFRHQAIDEKGVIPGALIYFRQGRTSGTVFTDKAGRIPARNPLPANSAGRAVAYLPCGEEFEVTVTRPDGSFVEQFDHTALPMGDVETVIEQAEPEIVEIEKIVEVPVEVEKIVEVIKEVPIEIEKVVYVDRPLEQTLDNLEAVKAKIDDRSPVREDPPAEIADLIDPSLTARQNLDALTAKFAAAKNMEEYCRANADMESAMKHLRDADRFESGIKWNRAVLAEVI